MLSPCACVDARPVTAGTRQVLVAEVWAGRERTCAHRCEQHNGDCPVTLGISRAAAEIDGLQEGAYGHWLNEMCSALQSSSRSEREKARDALARLQQLSDHAEAAHSSAENEPVAQAAMSSLRGELVRLSTKALRQRAAEVGVSFDDIENARNSKQQLVELVVAQAASKQPGEDSKAAKAAAAREGAPHNLLSWQELDLTCLRVIHRAALPVPAALKMEINNQGAIRENHYDMDCGDD